jgi:hypothetical protein
MIMGHMSDTKVGDRVEIIRCYDAYTKLKRGTQGTVTLIDQLGTVHVRWDDGRNLGLVPGQDANAPLVHTSTGRPPADLAGHPSAGITGCDRLLAAISG